MIDFFDDLYDDFYDEFYFDDAVIVLAGQNFGRVVCYTQTVVCLTQSVVSQNNTVV